MSPFQLVDYLWVIACVAQFAWAARLYALGLVSRYRMLFAYLVGSAAISAIRIGLQAYSPSELFGIPNPAGWFWAFSVPVMWMMEFCLLVDLATRLAEHYKGLQKLSRIVITVSSVAAGGLFLAMTVLDVSLRTWGQFWSAQLNAVDLSLTAFCFVLVVMTAFFRLPIARNVRITVGVLGVMAALNASFTLGRSIWEQFDPIARPMTVSIVAILVYGGAALFFSKAGEETSGKPPVIPQHAPAEAGAALREVNEALGKAIRS